MPSDAHDSCCDSLSPATMTPVAQSVRPLPRRRSSTWAAAAAAGLAVAVCGAWSWGAGPSVPTALADSPHVAGRTVSYSPGFAERAGIRMMVVGETSFKPVIAVSGKTSFDPEHVAFVSANASGLVRSVAKFEGQHVANGEALAEIGSALQARLDAGAPLRERKGAGRPLGSSLLRSPLAGTVIERRIVMGQAVRGESVIFVVADLDHLRLKLSVDEERARVLSGGERVEMSHAEGPSVTGRVVSVSRPEDASDAARTVNVWVDNRGRVLRPGQQVNVRIFASGAHALVVPNRALAWIAGKPAVFLATGNNSVSASGVTLGNDDGEQTEVRAGLALGQRFVSDGVSNLKTAAFL